MDEELKVAIQEEFSNAYICGKSGVAKLYAELRLEIDRQLEFFMNDNEEEEDAK